MKKFRRLSWIALALCSPAWGFNQPPANLSATTFFDGGGVPGLYYVNYSIFIDGRRAVDKNGGVIPGGAKVDALVSLHQLYYLTEVDVLGGKLGFDLLQPLVALTVQGALGPVPVTASTAGLGDLVAGPAVQWNGGTLLGRPLFQRVESDLTMPTGKYDKTKNANPGSNIWTSDSYYSFVWLFADKWETSWRAWYAYDSQNPDTHIKPGQRAHVNFAFSREVLPKLRLGAAGYVYRQISDDKLSGARVPDSRERVVAVGPGLAYLAPGLAVTLSHPFEFWAQNRFVGSRTTLQLIYRF